MTNQKAPEILNELNAKMNVAQSQCVWWHTWSKWESYKQTIFKYHVKPPPGYQFIEDRQRRFCVDCGFKEDKKL